MKKTLFLIAICASAVVSANPFSLSPVSSSSAAPVSAPEQKQTTTAPAAVVDEGEGVDLPALDPAPVAPVPAGKKVVKPVVAQQHKEVEDESAAIAAQKAELAKIQAQLDAQTAAATAKMTTQGAATLKQMEQTQRNMQKQFSQQK